MESASSSLPRLPPHKTSLNPGHNPKWHSVSLFHRVDVVRLSKEKGLVRITRLESNSSLGSDHLGEEAEWEMRSEQCRDGDGTGL